MIIIERVKCPICNQSLIGGTTSELNSNLRTHMADEHNMRRLSTPSSGAASKGPSFYPESRTEREVETFSGREPYGGSVETQRKVEEGSQWRYPEGKGSQREIEEAGQWRSQEQGRSQREIEEAGRWKSPERGGTSREVEEASQWRSSEEGGSTREAEEAGQWRYPRSGGQREMESAQSERHGGGWGHRMMHRNDQMSMSMACPICDRTVFGSDDEDLSDELRFHFKDAHRDVMDRY